METVMVMRSREEEEPPAAIASQFPPRCLLDGDDDADEEEGAACRGGWKWRLAGCLAWDARGVVAEEGEKAKQRVAAWSNRPTTMGRSILHMAGGLGALVWA